MRKFVILALCLINATAAFSKDFLGDTSAGFAASGFSADLQDGTGRRKVVMTIDQVKAVASMPMLQSMGVINPELTQTYINGAPFTLTGTTATFFTVAALPELYKTHSEVDQVDVSVVDAFPDDYGNEKRREILSFSFNRALYQKINWDNFAPVKLMKVAPGFKFSPWYLQTVAQEQQ